MATQRIKAPDLIQTTRFWGVGHALSLVNERYIFQLHKSPDARGAAQLIARRRDDGYSLSLVYNPAKKKAPGPQREDIIDTGMTLDDALDFMSAFERIGRDHDTHAPMPEEHRLANRHIGDTHIRHVTEQVQIARFARTQANRLRRIGRYKPGQTGPIT